MEVCLLILMLIWVSTLLDLSDNCQLGTLKEVKCDSEVNRSFLYCRKKVSLTQMYFVYPYRFSIFFSSFDRKSKSFVVLRPLTNFYDLLSEFMLQKNQLRKNNFFFRTGLVVIRHIIQATKFLHSCWNLYSNKSTSNKIEILPLPWCHNNDALE